MTANSGDDLQMDVQRKFPDEAKAKSAQEAIKNLLVLAQALLAGVKLDPAKNDIPGPLVPLLDPITDLLPKIPVEQKDTLVLITIKTEGGALANALTEGVPQVQEAKNRIQIPNN